MVALVFFISSAQYVAGEAITAAITDTDYWSDFSFAKPICAVIMTVTRTADRGRNHYGRNSRTAGLASLSLELVPAVIWANAAIADRGRRHYGRNSRYELLV